MSPKEALNKIIQRRTVVKYDEIVSLLNKVDHGEDYHLFLPTNCERTYGIVCHVDGFKLAVAWLCINSFCEISDSDFEDRLMQYDDDKICISARWRCTEPLPR